MEKISVVIVSWNVAEALKRCITSILATKYSNLDVIVVDNNSADDSAKIAKSFSIVILINNSSNLGFPKAVNQGLEKSTGDYILILNPDARIPENFFTKSVEFIKSHPDAGVMGPKLVNTDNTPQGSVFPDVTIASTINEYWLGHKGLNTKYTPQSDRAVSVHAISGACLFLPLKVVNRVGPMAEEVFMYYEDLEYCRRIRVLGLKVYFNPEIKVTHEHGASSKQSPTASDWRGQLWKSSQWYNGPIKHYLMWLISWSGQKLHRAKI